jgi:hypothetical protein
MKRPIHGYPPLRVVVVSEHDLAEAQAFVVGCECCRPDAVLSFDYLLDAVTGCDPLATEYFMSRCACCPRCFGKIAEKTLVVAA